MSLEIVLKGSVLLTGKHSDCFSVFKEEKRMSLECIVGCFSEQAYCCYNVTCLTFVLQVVGMAALACGMISVATCNGEVTSTILQTLIEKSVTELKDTYARFLALGLGLCYLGMYSRWSCTVQTLVRMVETCGQTGSVQVQNNLFAT